MVVARTYHSEYSWSCWDVEDWSLSGDCIVEDLSLWWAGTYAVHSTKTVTSQWGSIILSKLSGIKQILQHQVHRKRQSPLTYGQFDCFNERKLGLLVRCYLWRLWLGRWRTFELLEFTGGGTHCNDGHIFGQLSCWKVRKGGLEEHCDQNELGKSAQDKRVPDCIQ